MGMESSKIVKCQQGWKEIKDIKTGPGSKRQKVGLLYIDRLLPCYSCQGDLESQTYTYVHVSTAAIRLLFMLHIDFEMGRLIPMQ